MTSLFIIEAPFKRRALEQTLAGMGIDAKVHSTKGHLYAMPESLDRLAIDRGFREFERKLINPDIGRFLREQSAEASDVYIATDADSEGDVIAWDVAELIADIRPEPYRVRLKGMDEDSIREALDAATFTDKRDAVPGRTRAIVDRMIGATFSTRKVAVGRVSTALLGLVRDNPLPILKLRLTAPSKDGGRPWVAETDVKPPLDEGLAERLVKVRFPPMGLAAAASKPYSKPPGNMGDIMVRAGDELDLSPKEAASSLQRLYEAGRMSYPRSGSRGISRGALNKVHEVLRKAGYEFKGENVAAKPDHEVHDAPYPIGGVDVQRNPELQGTEEGLRTIVGRDILRSGQRHVAQLGVGETAGKHLRGLGFPEEVAKFVAGLHWRREEGPRYPGQEAWPKNRLMERRQDTVLLEAAVAAGLGRPSTWANHVEKFLSRGLVDDRFRLTEKGRAWVGASPALLLDPRISAYIENACEKNLSGMMDDPDREPWEILAERIVSVLPPEIKTPILTSIESEAPRPKSDPAAPFRPAPSLEDVIADAPERNLAYAPSMPSLEDY